MTRAVLFDLGDTLFRLNPMSDVTDAFAEFLATEGVEDAETEALRVMETFRERMMAGYGRGQLEEPRIAELVRPFLGDGPLAEKGALHLEGLLGEADIERWEPSDRRHVLESVRGLGLRVGFVSNTLTAPEVMRRRLREFELLHHANVAIFSVEHGVRKPNPRIYEIALDAVGVAPEDVVFVGDRVREDVRGPQSLGMRSILTHEFRQEDPADSAPLAVVSSLEGILPHLGA